MSDTLTLTVWLHPRDREAFGASRAAVLGATPLAARTYRSREDLRVAGDADARIFAALEAQLRAAGLVPGARQWRRVTAHGARAACAAAVRALDAPPLAGEVAGVFGLDATPPARCFARRRAAHPARGLTPLDVARAYRLPPGLTGSGTTVGIVHLTGTFREADLEQALAALQLPVPAVSIDGTVARAGGDDYEIALDSQVCAALAPGARFVLYAGTNDAAGYVDAIARALLDAERAPSVVSISYGVAETFWDRRALDVIDQLFVAAALCGITVVTSSGDLGSEAVEGEPQVFFPASSAFVLACGGTQLQLEGGRRLSEVVWSEDGAASGGGYSKRSARPSWQAPEPGRDTRGLPDVAGHAATENGYRVYVGGEAHLVGGTSAVAPLWAAFFALANERLERRCGFVTPLLYRAPQAELFYDVTSGATGRYRARPGWDACTGFGSPHFGNILLYLAGSGFER